MNRGIIHKLISKARKYLKKMKGLEKKLLENPSMVSIKDK
jgi:hypothetical protein